MKHDANMLELKITRYLGLARKFLSPFANLFFCCCCFHSQTGGLLPSRRHALAALAIHRWDPSAVANWLLENEQAAISEINRRLREEDAAKKAEADRAAAKAAEEKKLADAKTSPAAPATPKSKTSHRLW